MLISIPCVLMALLAAPEIKPTLIAPRAERAEVAALPSEWFVGHDRGFEIAASLHSALLAHETERARVQISVADLGLVTLSLHRVRAVTSDALATPFRWALHSRHAIRAPNYVTRTFKERGLRTFVWVNPSQFPGFQPSRTP